MADTLNIHAGDSLITLRNIERGSLYRVLEWYNSGDVYRYATGTDKKITLDELEDRFGKIDGNDKEFFLGIYRSGDDRLVGIITGSLIRRILWIKLLAVDLACRRMGYGTSAAAALLDYFRRTDCASVCCLSVVERNAAGRSFWLRNGFRDVKRLGKRRLFEETDQDIIIMQKSI